MENKNELLGTANHHMFAQDPSSSTDNTYVNSFEGSASSISMVRPANYSIQTGEEFSIEFMRERANTRKTSAQNVSSDTNAANHHVDLKGILGICRTESEIVSAEVPAYATGEKDWHKVLEKKNNYEIERKGPFESTMEVQQSSICDGSNRGTTSGHSSSVSSDNSSTKVRFLCSFGGKILPRPSDGKLRYVGGDTRIIRISKGISWQDFMQRTLKIYNQPHTIKYQLPGEDLDALISVSCDEDLQNMMEECSALEGGDGSQKLRMFLFSSADVTNSQSILGDVQADSDIQYMIAVNCMGSGIDSSGHSLASMSGNYLDQLLGFDTGDDPFMGKRTEVNSAAENAVPQISSSTPATLPSTLMHAVFPSSGSNIHSHQGQDGHYLVPSGYTQDILRNTDNRISNPLPYDYRSQHGYPIGSSVSGECSDASLFQKGVSGGFYGGPHIPQAPANHEISKPDGYFKKNNASEKVQHLDNEHVVRTNGFDQSIPSYSQANGQHLNIVLDPPQCSPNSDLPCEPNDDINSHASSETFVRELSESGMTDCSSNGLPSRPYRVFHSEHIPRELSELKNRLSKSDDSLSSQLEKSQLSSEIPPQDSISESAGPFKEGKLFSLAQHPPSVKQLYSDALASKDEQNLFFQAEHSSSSVKQSYPNGSTIEQLKLKEHIELPKAPIHVKHREPLSDVEIRDALTCVESSTSGSRENQNEGTTHAMMDIKHNSEIQTDEQGSKMRLQKSDVHGTKPVNFDRQSVDGDALQNEIDANRYMKGQSLVSERGKADGHLKHPSADDPTENKFKGSTIKQHKDSSSPLENNPPFALPENPINVVSQAGPLEFDSMEPRKDILIDINDRFPPNLLSDIFRARIAEDSSNILHNDAAALSLNVHNHEPKSWSFFRNLAQDAEFDHKDVSLMDQDLVGYSSSHMLTEEGAPSNYAFAHSKDGEFGMDCEYSETGFVGKMQKEISPTNCEAALEQEHLPSHDKGNEVLQADDNFQKLGDDPKPLVSEYEEGNMDSGYDGPFIDTSIAGLDLSNLQMIKNEDLEEQKELGSGTFGTVYHGKWRGSDVAIKRIKKSCFAGRSSEQERLTLEFWREAEILSKLHHPNVVAFYGVVEDGSTGALATVTEYMVNGSLRHVLLRKEKYLDFRKRVIIATDAAFGMEYLHSKNIVHFDLKCDNLLVNLKDTQRPICKVGDFGLSKIKRNTLVSGGVRGTLPWMAPELLNGTSTKVSEKVDVFSFGIVMWEILTSEEPYANMHYGAIIGGIVNNTLRPSIPDQCDPEWRRLMEQCWAPDPVQRPSFTEIASRLRQMSVACQNRSGK